MSDEKNKNFEKSLVSIDWDYEGLPSLHCPVTGKMVLGAYRADDDWDEDDHASVETLRFVYAELVGDFVYIHPALEEALELRVKELEEELGEEDFDFEFDGTPWGVLCAEINKFMEMPFVYELRSNGMACGPVSESVFAGIELAPLEE